MIYSGNTVSSLQLGDLWKLRCILKKMRFFLSKYCFSYLVVDCERNFDIYFLLISNFWFHRANCEYFTFEISFRPGTFKSAVEKWIRLFRETVGAINVITLLKTKNGLRFLISWNETLPSKFAFFVFVHIVWKFRTFLNTVFRRGMSIHMWIFIEITTNRCCYFLLVLKSMICESSKVVNGEEAVIELEDVW